MENSANPFPRTLKPGLVRVLAMTGGISVLIFVFIAIVSVKAMRQIATLATDTRDNVLPLVTENQRTAINLERLGKFGESIMTEPDRNRRRELRLAAQMLSNDAIYEKNEKATGVIREAFKSIRKITANKDKQDLMKDKIRERIVELDTMIAMVRESENRTVPSETHHEKSGSPVEKLLSLRLALSDMFSARSPDESDSFHAQIAEMMSGLDSLAKNLAGDIAPELGEKVLSLNDGVSEIFSNWKSIIETDAENKELWSNARSELDQLSDSLSLTAAVTASERFSDISSSANRVMIVGVMGMAGIALVVIFITFLVHYYVIIPIIRATGGLERIHREGKSVTLPSTLLREPDKILRAVEQLGNVVENLKAVQEELRSKNIRLREMNDKLRDANQQIMSSIRYAEMIQSSLLPTNDRLKQYLPESFVIWMPRDIVGGDVVFIEFLDDAFIIAVLDCTGHGVPGAMMAMIAFSSLERIVRGESCRNPAEILKRLNYLIKTILKQDTENTFSDDGMDAVVCVIQTRTESDPPRLITCAGARLSLIMVHNGKINMVKGDRQSLGYKRSDLDFNYTNHTFQMGKGMSFYMYTDGFVDQIGGKNNRKFGSRQFFELLKTISGFPIHERREMLISAFNDHRGESMQRDDVTVVGFEF